MTDIPQWAAQTDPHAIAAKLPDGYTLEQDDDGDWWLFPPADVTIFSAPGEGWLIADDYMVRRDWNNEGDLVAACVEYLKETSNAE